MTVGRQEDAEAGRGDKVDELEAKRVEKVRSHASSHHCAGTVTPDDVPVDASPGAPSPLAPERAAGQPR